MMMLREGKKNAEGERSGRRATSFENGTTRLRVKVSSHDVCLAIPRVGGSSYGPCAAWRCDARSWVNYPLRLSS